MIIVATIDVQSPIVCPNNFSFRKSANPKNGGVKKAIYLFQSKALLSFKVFNPAKLPKETEINA